MLGSILTRQYRFATRGIAKTLRTAHEAMDIAGGLVGEVAERLGGCDGHGDHDVVSGEAVPPPEPVASPPAPPVTSATAPRASREPAPAPPAARTPAPEPAPPEPAHVSAEPELVEEFSEPGAEDGAGAQVHIAEPWPGYRHLKARDVIARLPSATRAELATVELFESAGANRKSVVVAAQRALKKASPPR